MTAERPSRATQSQPEQAATLVLGRTAATLAEVVTPLLLVRLITKDDLGVLASLMLVFSTAAMIAATGFPRALLYFLPNRPLAERRVIAWRIGKILLALGVIAGALIIAFDLLADPVSRLVADLFGDDASAAEAPAGAAGRATVRAHLGLVSLYLVFDLPTRMLTNVLIVEGRARAAAGTALLKSIGTTVATLVPAALDAGIAGILLSIVAFSALYSWLYVHYMRSLYRGAEGGAAASSVSVRELAKFAIPLGMTDIINVLNQGLDRFLIMFFFTAAAFADYQVGAWKIPVVSTISYAVGNVFLPRFKRAFDERRPDEAIAIWRQSSLKVSLVVVPVTVGFFVGAEELVTLLFTEDYLAAVPVFRWYMLLTLGRVTQFAAPILAAGRPRYILYASAFTVASNLAISLPLALLVGFEGPAMGTAIAFVPTVMIYCYFIARSSGVAFSRTFPLVGYLRIVAVGVVAGAAAWGTKAAVDLPAVATFPLVVVVTLLVFGLVGSLVREIDAQDWRFARDFVRLRVLR